MPITKQAAHFSMPIAHLTIPNRISDHYQNRIGMKMELDQNRFTIQRKERKKEKVLQIFQITKIPAVKGKKKGNGHETMQI